jgi:regulator of protease activity HflC (stomatin/prohibitin superfamily)
MKQLKTFFLFLFTILTLNTMTSCESVPPGHKGVEISWGGKTNMDTVYSEGIHWGLHWMADDMVHYDVRQKTLVKKFEFNDKDNMSTPVEIALDYNLDPKRVNLLHTTITDLDEKILKTLSSAGKEVVPKYSAVELNTSKRPESEKLISDKLTSELSSYFVIATRVQLTDVDLPPAVAQLAEETAVQLGKNELASKKEAEQVALAKARVAEAQGEYDAAQLQAKTKDILSQPKMLQLMELEIEQTYADGYKLHGNSRYGSNNMFGIGTSAVLKEVK